MDEYLDTCQRVTNNHTDNVDDHYSESGTYTTFAYDSDVTCVTANNNNSSGAKRFKPHSSAPSDPNALYWSSEHKAAAGLSKEAKIYPSTVNVKGPGTLVLIFMKFK